MPKKSSAASPAFVRIEVRVAPGAGAERVMAEAFDAGAAGWEERSSEDGLTLVLYASRDAAAGVARAVEAVAPPGAVAAPEPVADADWSDLWKRGLRETVVSPRLVIRPSFVAFEPGPRQAELVIDPGQAFGTGAHESTRLALELLDAHAAWLSAEARVLDLGCGSGVLALAALARSPARATACDLDPLAAEATRANAEANGLSARTAVFVGSAASLRPGRFDLVLANLLRRELEGVLPGLVACLRPGGRAVVSGLLARESEAVLAALAAAGLAPIESRERRDASGELWRAWLMRR